MTPLAVPPRAWLVAVVALSAGVSGVVAAGPSSAAVPRVPFEPPVSDQRAVDLLRTAYDAERTLSYSGTAFVGLGSSYLRVRLRHVPGQGTYVAPDDAARGAATLQPDALRGASSEPLSMLRENYQLLLGGTARVAGRPVTEIRAKRPGGGLAATFSVDRGTGLVLARSAYDQSGRRYEQVMFTDVSVQPSTVTQLSGADGIGSSTVIQHGRPVGGSVLSANPPIVPADTGVRALRSSGWYIDEQLPGGFELYDARVTGAGSGAVLHLSYSDGLSSLSVFEERGRLRAAPLAGWQAVQLPAPAAGRTVYADGSSPQRLAWQGGEMVYALLSDAAPARVAAVVASLPYGEPAAGLVDRMRRGFDRLGSWVDPFR